jgi:cellulose biosynthesis protein BcsQ
MAESSLQTLLDNFKTVAEGKEVPRPQERFKTYAITNFRGGIGKSTLAFNLSWEISRLRETLLVDVCPQRNFTQSLLGDESTSGNPSIYDALLPYVMAGNAHVTPSELLCAVQPYCPSFKGGKRVFVAPGSNDLFLFPSLLYSQLSQAAQLGQGRSKDTILNILNSLSSVIASLVKEEKIEATLIDTSPFFGGATHLAWVAADALVIPVRVDQHSMEALKLTLSMLRSPDMDFLRLNKMAGIDKVPKVHAIAMTHCGWNRQEKFTPDRSTQSYLSQVVEIAEANADLFSCGNPIQCIHILDDFHSAGRISGSKRIPLAKLTKGETHTIQGQKLEVNVSLDRYQNELRSLASSL